MRRDAARSIEEESHWPASREAGEVQINHATVDRAYRDWMARRGLQPVEGWFTRGKKRRATNETTTPE
jgi:hypothetical protein